MMSPSKRDRRSELDATRFGSQRPTAQWEWLMAAERDALSPGPGSPVLKPRNDGGSSARYNRVLVKVPRKAGRLGIGLNDANQVTTLVSANGLQVQDRCGATTTHSIAHRYGLFGAPLCPCLEHVPQCPWLMTASRPSRVDLGRVVAIDGVELQGRRLDEVMATLPQRGMHEIAVVRAPVVSARRSHRVSQATSAPSMLAEKKPEKAKKASSAPSLSGTGWSLSSTGNLQLSGQENAPNRA